MIDPYAVMAAHPFVQAWVFKSGSLWVAGVVSRFVRSAIGDERFEIAFVDNGELLDANLVVALKNNAHIVINFNLDNPFTTRDGLRWRLLRKALPHYDLFVTPRYSSVEAAERLGAKCAIRVTQSADEIAHRPVILSVAETKYFRSDVAFVGTWMPERGPFMAELIQRGVPLRIFGPRWHKAPEYKRLAAYIVNGHLNGDDYVKAISGTKIALALLSKGNRDLHTTRSLEIPAIGRLLCGERTSEHLEIFEDGKEAVFWSNAEECADLCLSLLKTPVIIEQIAHAGTARVLANGNFNESTLARVLHTAGQLSVRTTK
ncbi:spore maturation protein CgeB [Rhodoblastus sphagnicola]|nr:spore maturation protein CgeB [Rhodoblastus sphagnicola]